MTVYGQTETAPYKIYVGMANQTDSFNGVPNFRSPLLGWDTALAFPTLLVLA
jgi:hypothetical protein